MDTKFDVWDNILKQKSCIKNIVQKKNLHVEYVEQRIWC